MDISPEHEQVDGMDDSNIDAGVTDDVNTVAPEATGKTLAEIKSAYRTIFTDLENQESSKMDQLLVKAKADYVSGKYSQAQLTSKYSNAAAQLDRSADQMFNAIYAQLQADLTKYGHDPQEAVAFRSEYNSKKQARLSHAVNQLQNF